MRSRLMVSGASAAMIAAMIAANPAVAQAPDAKPYIVLMDAPPVITLDSAAAQALEGESPGARRAAPAEEQSRPDPNSRQSRTYAAELEAQQDDVLEAVAAGAQVTHQLTYAVNGFAAQLTEEQALEMSNQKGVMQVMEDELLQPQTDASGSFLQLDVRKGAYDSGLDGEGVTIGVIDTGIWPEHPSFADDGSFDRPEGLADDIPCDFGDQAYNPDDEPFECQNKLIGARDMRITYEAVVGSELYSTARDSDGHGTHTASTAGGNADVDAEIFDIPRGSVTGIAPRASVIAYKGLGDLGGFGSDLAAAIDAAVADGVDVINYSIGSPTPSLSDADDIAFLFAANAGVHVATSNGNSGPAAETVGGPASIPWVTSVGASTHDRAFTNPVQIGTIGAGGFILTGTSITESSETATLVDSEDLGNELCQPGGFDADVTGKIVLCLRGVNARVEKSEVVADAGGVGMILYNANDAQSLVTDSHFIPASHVTNTQGLEIKGYIDAAGEAATAKIGQGEKSSIPGSSMAAFSSRGPVGSPASADIIRPDVTAPGVNILAGNTPTPGDGRPGQLFQSISGTSMSSPHVAGLFAIMAEAHPDWSPAAIRSAVMTSARQDVTKEDGVTQADPFDMGAGHVDPGKPSKRDTMFQPGIVYDAGFSDYLAFLCGAAEGVVAPSSCDQLETNGYSTDASNLNLASIGASGVVASETLTRTVTNVSGRRLNLKAVVEQMDGFDVTVSPKRLKLQDGETASFEITITNTSATPDEWVFGSLTWKGNGFQAHSPIAASGAALAAPEEVMATGASGSTSFDVSFGYTGDYTAAAHGLAAEDPIVGSVGQDPDQTFDPSDEGNGATPFTLDLGDTAFFRFTLDQADVTGPGADAADLDIFVLDSAGTTVATSTAGGTAEIIEMVQPDPGTYTLWVHGWQTGGEVLDFNGHSWNVPATPNTGSLSIDSAPTSATAGTTEQVTVSWTGVAPESTSLGAVSHSDGDGLLGLTLVNVTNDEPAP